MENLIKYFKSLSGRIVIGVFFGLIVGLSMGPSAGNFKILGDIFLRLMNMCVPFLIFGSIVMSVSSIDLKDFRTIGSRTLLLFLITTAAASFFSLGVGVLLPYTTAASAGAGVVVPDVATVSATQVILGFFPNNILEAFTKPFILQIIVFALFYGIGINLLKDTVPGIKTLLEVTLAFRSIIMKTISIVMYIAPIGIFGIIANVVGTKGSQVIGSLGLVLLYISLINIAFFALYTIFISVRYQLNIFTLLKKTQRLIIFAATTTSTALSLTVAMEDIKYLGVKDKLSNFILPLGSSLNTNGGPITNVVIGIAAIHLFHIPADTTMYIMLAIYATIAAFGNPGVIGGALVSLFVVFDLTGLPREAAVLFFGLDAFYGITRVVLNICGSFYCCIIMAHARGEFDRNVFNESLDQYIENQGKSASAS